MVVSNIETEPLPWILWTAEKMTPVIDTSFIKWIKPTSKLSGYLEFIKTAYIGIAYSE